MKERPQRRYTNPPHASNLRIVRNNLKLFLTLFGDFLRSKRFPRAFLAEETSASFPIADAANLQPLVRVNPRLKTNFIGSALTLKQQRARRAPVRRHLTGPNPHWLGPYIARITWGFASSATAKLLWGLNKTLMKKNGLSVAPKAMFLNYLLDRTKKCYNYSTFRF